MSDRKKKKNRALPDFDPIPLIEYLHKYVYSAKVPTVLRDELDTETQSFR